MALYKETLSDYGFMVSYWNIGDIRINKKYKFCDITMYGYVNQETRLSNQEPANEKYISIVEDEFNVVCEDEVLNSGDNIYEVLYNYIKHNDEFFKDAEDILD